MELSPDVVERVIHPTAPFIFDSDTAIADIVSSHPADKGPESMDWGDSQLNPKNRVDSLAPLESPLWRIDGCTSFGSQFFAIPTFLGHPIPPLRLDVFIPKLSMQSRLTRDLLDLDQAFHTRGRRRVGSLAISMHILRKLQSWTKQLEDPRKYILGLPFGSRIVFKNLSLDINRINIEVAQLHALETQLCSTGNLRLFWGKLSLPPCIDIADVHVKEQIHDSTCLVNIEGQDYILKALTSYPKYLYHELKLLLRMKPHPNIISRPVHLVTKKTTFGIKQAVIGFTLEYHPYGTMRDIIPHLASNGSLTLQEQFKWAIQITTALLHHRQKSRTFYPDLRLDNIVMSAQRNAIMVDFEQRGVWCEFASPEVNAIEYMRILAQSEHVRPTAREEFVNIMDALCPGFEDVSNRESYNNTPDSYNVTWMSLNNREQEAAEVYMLARVLWCIFEGVSAPQKATIWVSYHWESHLEFPEYERAPPLIRALIDRCTKGRRPTLDSEVIRRGNKLYLNQDVEENSKPEAVIQKAREWWKNEIAWAAKYVSRRANVSANGKPKSNPFDRPSLNEVLESLCSIKEEMRVD